jgi:hypothetical protein
MDLPIGVTRSAVLEGRDNCPIHRTTFLHNFPADRAFNNHDETDGLVWNPSLERGYWVRSRGRTNTRSYGAA